MEHGSQSQDLRPSWDTSTQNPKVECTHIVGDHNKLFVYMHRVPPGWQLKSCEPIRAAKRPFDGIRERTVILLKTKP